MVGLEIPDPRILKGRGIRGACFYVNAILKLENGTSVPTTIDTERKKNLERTIQMRRTSIAAGAMSHDPKTGMTITKWTIGGAGLVPNA